MAAKEVRIEENDTKDPDSDEALPNEIIYIESSDSKGRKNKEVIILDGEEIFKFRGRTGFFEEEKSAFQNPGHLKLQDAIPVIPKRVAVACLVLNFMFPGLGTAIGAFASLICPCEPNMANRWLEVFVWNIVAAICQLATTVYFFIGYFWGIWWAIQMVQKSPSRVEEKTYSINIGREKKQSYVEKSARSQTTTKYTI